MRSTIIAAAASLLAAPAPAQSVDFTFPSDGSSFDVGSTISVTGTATGATTAGDLDLTVFIDTSFSTSLRPLAGEGDSRQLVDITTQAITQLFGTLSDGTTVSAIEFNSRATNVFEDLILSATTRPGIASQLAALFPNGGTDFSAALQQGIDNGVATGDQFLFFSDGQTGGSFQTEAEAIAAAGGILNTVGLPGTDVDVLAAIATAGGGTFFDLTDDVGRIVDILTGVDGGGNVVGLSGLTVTLPDGTTVSPTANAFGQFTLPGFTIGAGENLFLAEASFDDGSIATASLRITGDDGGGSTVIPLPATAWMLLAGVAALGGLRRRRG